MTPFEQAINEIDVYGFTLIPDVLAPEQLEPLKQALIQSAQRVGEDGYENRGGTSLLVRNLPTLDPIFFQKDSNNFKCLRLVFLSFIKTHHLPSNKSFLPCSGPLTSDPAIG